MKTSTCIVALKSPGCGTVYLGGDSAGVSSDTVALTAHPKVFQRTAPRTGRPLMIGFGYTTSFRMGQILQFMTLPRVEFLDLYEYLVEAFVPAVRLAFKAGGFARVNDNIETGGQFLLTCEGRIFTVESDFQVFEVDGRFHAIGCGAPFAMGALYALSKADEEWAPIRAVEIALEAAEQFSTGVRRPFRIVAV